MALVNSSLWSGLPTSPPLRTEGLLSVPKVAVHCTYSSPVLSGFADSQSGTRVLRREVLGGARPELCCRRVNRLSPVLSQLGTSD